jgi:hypothetical protein
MLFIRMLLLRGLWSFWVGNEIGCKMIIIIRNSWFGVVSEAFVSYTLGAMWAWWLGVL